MKGTQFYGDKSFFKQSFCFIPARIISLLSAQFTLVTVRGKVVVVNVPAKVGGQFDSFFCLFTCHL